MKNIVLLVLTILMFTAAFSQTAWETYLKLSSSKIAKLVDTISYSIDTKPGEDSRNVLTKNLAGDSLLSFNAGHFYQLPIDTTLLNLSLDNYWIYDYYYYWGYYHEPSEAPPKIEYDGVVRTEISDISLNDSVFHINMIETLYRPDGTSYTGSFKFKSTKHILRIKEGVLDIPLFLSTVSKDTSWSIWEDIIRAEYSLENASFNFNNESHDGQLMNTSGYVYMLSFSFNHTFYTLPYIGPIYKNFTTSSEIITQRKYRLANCNIDGVYYGGPHRPLGVKVESSHIGLKISWQQNIEDNISEYKIYGGFGQNPDSLIYVTSETNYFSNFPVFTNSTKFYIAVSAVNDNGIEGRQRTIVLETVPAVEDVAINLAENRLILRWSESKNQNSVGYNIYGDIDPHSHNLLHTTNIITDTTTEFSLRFLFNNFEIDSILYFSVGCYDSIGLESPLTSISISLNEIFPDKITLYQNYPNPFNTGTTIQFSLKETKKVKIDLFNTTGQKVTTITNKEFKAGLHAIEFTSEILASGVYYYRMIAGENTDVKKMVILK
jgi:hypothetical protein